MHRNRRGRGLFALEPWYLYAKMKNESRIWNYCREAPPRAADRVSRFEIVEKISVHVSVPMVLNLIFQGWKIGLLLSRWWYACRNFFRQRLILTFGNWSVSISLAGGFWSHIWWWLDKGRIKEG